MIILVTILHVIMCVVLVAIVLFQTGKGANMGAAFGGGSNTIFGGAGPASFLNKITTIAAIMFMVTSFTLAVLSRRDGSSSKVLNVTPIQQEQPVEQSAPPTAAEEEEQEPSSEATPEEGTEPE